MQTDRRASSWGSAASGAPARAYLFVRIGDRRLAFEACAVAAVLPLPRLLRPAGTPRSIIGFANVGGHTTAVLAPLTLLADADAPWPALDAHMLLLGPAAGVPAALLVDRADEVRTVFDRECRPVAAADSLNGCVTALIGDGEAASQVIAVDRLLLAAERRQVALLADAIARREQAAAG